MDSKLALHNPHLEGDTFFWESGPVGVLLAHGFTATTAEVRLLGLLLHRQGYTVAGPLLPGHGTTPEEMNNCRWQDWAKAMENAYQKLSRRCAQIFVGGESMGALLALHLANEHHECSGVLTYAPVLGISNKRTRFSRLLAPFIPFITKKHLNAINRNWQGYRVIPVRALVQLQKLQQVVKRFLPHMQQPLLIVQGRLDTTVDLGGVEMLYQTAGSPTKELHWMEHSGHVVILEDELEQVTEITTQFMNLILDGHYKP